MRVPSNSASAQASAVPAPAQPKDAQAPAPSGPDAPALAKDRLAVGATPLSKLIEVDAHGALGGDGRLAVTGTVRLDRVFMERLVRHVTRKEKSFGGSDMKWDAQSQSYAGSLVVKIKGHPFTLSGRAVPVVDGNQPGFRIEDLGIKLFGRTFHVPFLTGLATKIIAGQISNETLKASAGAKGVVRLEADSLLHEIDVLPGDVHLDTDRTRFSLQTDPQGHVTVDLKSDLAGPTGPNTPLSDVSLTLDEGAVRRELQPLLGSGFQLSKVRLDSNALALDGQAEVKALSDVGTLVRGLLAAIATAKTGRVVDAEPAKVTIPLTLALRFEGSQVVLTPSMRQALGQLEETLTKIGAKPVRDGEGLRFDLAALGAKYGLKTVEAKPGQLEAGATLDIGSLLGPPILRGEK